MDLNMNRTRNVSMPGKLPYIQNMNNTMQVNSQLSSSAIVENSPHQVDIYGMIREQVKVRRKQRNHMASIFATGPSSRATLHERYNSQLAGASSSFYGG
jgi:homoserine trans-succinylase